MIEIAGALSTPGLGNEATIPLHARASRFTVAGCCVAPIIGSVGVNDTSGAPGLAGGGVCRSPGSMAPTYSHPETERGATPRLRSSPNAQAPDSCANSRPAWLRSLEHRAGRFFPGDP